MSDWAPYQSSPPEANRDRSSNLYSPIHSPRPSMNPPSSTSQQNASSSSPWGTSYHDEEPGTVASSSSIGSGYSDVEGGWEGGGSGSGEGGGITSGSGFAGREYINQFETSLSIRIDFEAMMAYLILPPAGACLLLLLEHKSDYVRYHAWQSALLFTLLFVIHLIFSFSRVISWMLFVIDLVLILFLSYKAYQDTDTLDRFEVPYFGRLASNFVDEE